ncbi:MAG: hypothetical protein GY856_30980 [bacterium]|nr:hypothetical protein [bacterium]
MAVRTSGGEGPVAHPTGAAVSLGEVTAQALSKLPEYSREGALLPAIVPIVL